jgi:putative DNA primase/helicase
MRHLRDLASPVTAFVRDNCIVKPGLEIDKDDLWKAWKTWCENEGIKTGTKAVLIRDLRAAHPDVHQKRARDRDSRRNMLRGLQLRTPLTTPDQAHEQRDSDDDATPDQAAEIEGGQGWSGVQSTVDPTSGNGSLEGIEGQDLEPGWLSRSLRDELE